MVVAEVGVGAAALHYQYDTEEEREGERVPETGVVFEEVVDVHLVTGWLV